MTISSKGILFVISLFLHSFECVPHEPIKLEFDETNISKLELNINWKAQDNSANKFVLIMEQKRFMGTEYSSPILIDDEQTIETSAMVRSRFKARWPLRRKSKIDCAMNCINSSNLILRNNQSFDCNIFYYEPKYRICVLYQYDFSSKDKNEPSQDNFAHGVFRVPDNSIYDFFIDECEIDEILSGIHGYVRFCRRLLDYKESHTVKINPYVDYRFSLSVRGSNNTWSLYSRREYQYAPKITIEVKGDLKLGNNISIECKTDLHPSIIDSITWKNANQGSFSDGILYIKSLNHYNIYQTYFCEIRYNQARMMQKSFRLNITEIEQNLKTTPPKLKVDIGIDYKNLKVNMNWTVTVPPGNSFKPERIILLYRENHKPWRLVGKYLLFKLSKHDNVQFISHNKSEEIMVKDEEECAMHCLQSSFCDHFVYRTMDPIKALSQKNCHLTTNTHENIIDCRLDSICADLTSYEKNIQNNSVSISVLPNVTYKFRIQLKDKIFNWTNLEETKTLLLPLKLSVVANGETLLTEKMNSSKYELRCNTNLNKNSSVLLSWTKNGKDLERNDVFEITSDHSPYLNSILIFKSLSLFNFNKYSGSYRCIAIYTNSEIGQNQGVTYQSDESKVEFTFSEPLSYNISHSNITVPTIPGLLFELSCQVSGNPRPRIKWLIDGINYSEKKFETFTDEPFVINITFMDTWHMNHILVFKMDNKRKQSKYECILNDKITIRRHFIKVIDEKPQLDVKLNKASANELLDLKLDIEMKINHKNERFLNGLSSKPLKMSIMYIENSIFSKLENSSFNPGLFYETIRIAPDTLSHDSKPLQRRLDRVPIATLKNAERSMLSCKLLCFNTPFCQSYEHLVLENSCNFYSSHGIEKYYNNLIEEIRNQSNSSFNLLHLLRGNILSVLDEDLSWETKMLLADTKSIATSECESRHSTAEIHCSDQLYDFNETYTFQNLTPGTTYQFKIQVSNAFGQSDSFVTEQIEVPFPLDPISEKTSFVNNVSSTSLVCSTPLRNTNNLKFRWFRNEQLITRENGNFEQIVSQSSNLSKFSTELKFKIESSQLNGYYTCSLDFSNQYSLKTVSRNQSIIFRTRYGPNYTTYKDINLFKPTGSSWSDGCSAEGWPLPNVEWYFNDKLISNTTDNDLINPHIIKHHRHLVASSYLIINNLSQKLSGRYICIVNGNISIKNITIQVEDASDESKTSKSHNNEHIEPSKSSKSNNMSILIPVFLILSFVALATLSVYSYLQKRKRSNSDTSLSYNRIEEEIMTGVDNPNLLDDDTPTIDQDGLLIS